jgi:PAS domain S-box-containing protein
VLAFAAKALLAIGIAAYAIYAMYQQAEQATVVEIDNLASIAEARLDATLRRSVALLDLLSINLRPGDMAGAATAERAAHITADLRAAAQYFPEVGQITAIDASGQVRFTSRPGELANYADRGWFRDVKASPGKGLHFSDVIFGRLIKRPIVTVARALRDSHGEFLGVVSASMDMSYFQSIFAALDLGRGGVLNIRRSEDARLVTRWPDRSDASNKSVQTPLTAAILAGKSTGSFRFRSAVDNIDRIWTFRKVPGYPFVIVVGRASDDFLAAWRQSMAIIAALLTATVSLLGAFLYFAWQARSRELGMRGAIAIREARFRSLTELSADWYWEQDDQLRFIEFSSSQLPHVSENVNTDLGKARWELAGVEPMHGDWSDHQRKLALRQPFRDLLTRRRMPDGTFVYASVCGDPVFSADGRFTGYRGTSRDVTAQHEMLAALQHSQSRFESIVSTALDAVVTVDERHVVVLFNKAAERIFGYNAAEILGHPLDELLPMDSRAPHREHLGAFSRSGDTQRQMASLRVVYGRRKDGKHFPVEASISSLATDSGRLMTAILRDVTDRIEADHALKVLNESLDRRVRTRTIELEQVNREPEAFSYSVSHDLRGPLRAIGGYTSLLKEDLGADASAERTDLMDKILRSATKMSQLIDDVLEYGRATRADLKRGEVDMDREVLDVVTDLNMQYPQARFKLHTLGEAHADAGMVRQIFVNLVGNACKYSAMREVPEVEIGVTTNADVREYFVRDNGMGFDMAHTRHLYGMFRRLHSDPSIPGNGVGLSIVKRLIERLGGHIEAESAPGSGTTFRFSLGRGN